METAMISAISDVGGLIYHEIHVQSVTKEVFHDVLTPLEVILDEDDAVVVMDNAPRHRDAAQSLLDQPSNELPPTTFAFPSPCRKMLQRFESCPQASPRQHCRRLCCAASRRVGHTLRAHREDKL